MVSDRPLIEQLQICLVDDGGDLETVVPALAPQLARGNRTQLAMNERHELLEGVAAAALPLAEELRDMGGAGRFMHA